MKYLDFHSEIEIYIVTVRSVKIEFLVFLSLQNQTFLSVHKTRHFSQFTKPDICKLSPLNVFERV